MSQAKKAASITSLERFEPLSQEAAEAERRRLDAEVSDQPGFRKALDDLDRLNGPGDANDAVVLTPEMLEKAEAEGAASAEAKNEEPDRSTLHKPVPLVIGSDTGPRATGIRDEARNRQLKTTAIVLGGIGLLGAAIYLAATTGPTPSDGGPSAATTGTTATATVTARTATVTTATATATAVTASATETAAVSSSSTSATAGPPKTTTAKTTAAPTNTAKPTTTGTPAPPTTSATALPSLWFETKGSQ